jgi:hypothetical protein
MFLRVFVSMGELILSYYYDDSVFLTDSPVIIVEYFSKRDSNVFEFRKRKCGKNSLYQLFITSLLSFIQANKWTNDKFFTITIEHLDGEHLVSRHYYNV